MPPIAIHWVATTIAVPHRGLFCDDSSVAIDLQFGTDPSYLRVNPSRAQGEQECLSYLTRADYVGGLLSDHDGRGIRISGDDSRHHGRIHHAKAVNTMNSQPIVDHRHGVIAHFA